MGRASVFVAACAIAVVSGCGEDAKPSVIIGGTVSGLEGTGLVLQNDGVDDLSITANGTFTFATPIASGAAFAVTVKSQPSGPNQTCTVSGGTGTAGDGPVTTVVIDCAVDRFTVGGTISGLAGTVVLQNNTGDDISVSSNGSFAFPTKVASGAAYAVTVSGQPSTPSQTCVVTSGSGTVTDADITSVTVSCTTNSYTIGGTVMGLSGTGLVLQDNDGDDLPIGSDGSFTFATPIASGSTFEVTVAAQPASPTQTCVVSGGTGTVGGGNVTSVAVNCTTDVYVISGTISGLVGTVVLQDNGGDDLPVTSNGTFAFASTVASGATYDVTVLTQPGSPAQTCVISAGSGTVTSSDITDVVVTCTTNRYVIGGTLSGLAPGDTVVLRDNGADDLTLTADASFMFTTSVPSGQTYTVTVAADPTSPIAQTCTVTGGTGTVGSADVTDVLVTCTTRSYTIGGTVTGLSGTGLVLRNNGGDDLPITTGGTFTFASPIASGASYAVSVKAQPAGQICTVANGTGTVGAQNVTDVGVSCTSLTCQNGAVQQAVDPAGDMMICHDPLNTTCEQDFATECPAGWNLCTPSQFANRNAGWSYVAPTNVLGEIYCRANGGAGSWTILTSANLGSAQSFNCFDGSSRAACTAVYGCNEKQYYTLCCAPTPTCGDGVVNSPEEQCDDGNSSETDSCLNDCSSTFQTGC